MPDAQSFDAVIIGTGAGGGTQASALDPSCRAHGVDDLCAVDASFFPSSAAVKPGLTIMANALRAGDHRLARMGSRIP